MATIGELSGKLELDTKGFTSSVDKAIDKSDALTTSFNKVDLGIGKLALGFAGGSLLSQGIGKITDLLSNLVNVPFDFARNALEGAKATQALAESLKTLVGADEAKKLLVDLQTFARTTPFQLTELQNYTKQMLAANFATGEIIPTLEALGDIASAVGMDKLPALVYVLGQTRVASKFAGNDLLQFRNAGINLDKVFREKLNLSVDQVNDKIASGAMTYQEAETAILSLGRASGQFDGLMTNLSQNTLVGLESNLQDTIDQFLNLVGGINGDGTLLEGGFLDNVQSLIRQIGTYLASPEGVEMLQTFGESLSLLFGAIVDLGKQLLNDIFPRIQPAVEDFTKYLASEQFTKDLENIKNLWVSIKDGIVSAGNEMRKFTNSPEIKAIQSYADQWNKSPILEKLVPILPLARSSGILPKYAEGTDNHKGGMAIVGEKGPEVVNLPRGSQVIPNNQISKGSGVTINNTNYFSSGLDLNRFNEKMNYQLKLY